MITTTSISEHRVLTLFRTLPEQKQVEVVDFMLFMLHQLGKPEHHSETSKAKGSVEDTWGTLTIDRDTLIYLAEDKELEYDV